MKHPKPGRAKADRGTRNPLADRALFEQEVARLDPMSAAEKAEVDESRAAAPGRRARFTKRAARGEAEPDAKLDLHGLDREAATARLRSFLSGAPEEVEVVLIVHGRGLGILEALTLEELDRHPRVAEHLGAPGKWGGAGARLARLRRGSLR
jgi:DNA-nicking Smr family endonuclease